MKIKYRRTASTLLVVVFLLILTGCPSKDYGGANPAATENTAVTENSTTPGSLAPTEKPVIYLYPLETTEVTVQLRYAGQLTTTYPAYNDGWKVTAYSDGTLINHDDGKEYSYLFWEGQGDHNYGFEQGFVVKGSDTTAFLQETLAFMGLLPKEYNDFIVYWLPRMQENPYNLISFQKDAYTESAKLDITPPPDSILRVFMTFKPLMEPVEIPEQVLQPFERKGFSVVEWGGSAIE